MRSAIPLEPKPRPSGIGNQLESELGQDLPPRRTRYSGTGANRPPSLQNSATMFVLWSSTPPRTLARLGRSRAPVDFSVNAVGTLNMLEAARQLVRKPCLFSPRPTKSMGTRPTGFPWSSSNHVGKSLPTTTTTTAFAKICRSTRRCTACSALRKSPPTSWCRSMAGISACGRPVSVEDVSLVRTIAN